MPRRSSSNTGGNPAVAGVSRATKQAPKCQRPRTTGARTSGAAELFSGRPSAGAIKHRRRRCNPFRDDRLVSQGQVFGKFRIDGRCLLRKLSDNRPSYGRSRGRRRLRRLNLLNRFVRLCRPPWLGVGERQDQRGRSDNGAHHPGDGFRIHRGIPLVASTPQTIMPAAAPRSIAISPLPCA
jgi:hypothetical protein